MFLLHFSAFLIPLHRSLERVNIKGFGGPRCHRQGISGGTGWNKGLLGSSNTGIQNSAYGFPCALTSFSHFENIEDIQADQLYEQSVSITSFYPCCQILLHCSAAF